MSDIDGWQCIELGRRFVELHNEKLLTAGNLDFGESGNREEDCGTVACHGGWAALILDSTVNPEVDPYPYQSYELGALAIGRFVGFTGEGSLLDWADSNPLEWGNEFGHYMFDSNGYSSFGVFDAGQCTVGDIGMHWVAVGCRVLGLEVLGDE